MAGAGKEVKVTTTEALKLGFKLGQLARAGEFPMVAPLELSIPPDISVSPSLTGAYRLGYQTGIIGRRTKIPV